MTARLGRRGASPDRNRWTLAIPGLAGAIALLASGSAPAAYPGVNGRLLFTSTQHGARHIFVTTRAGIEDLTGARSPLSETQPEYSPSGRKIAFTRWGTRFPNGQVFVMRADGTHRQELTDTPTGNADATWSPNGRRIAFVSDRRREPDIYVMKADGSHVRRITHNRAAETALAWSPTGRAIAFVREPAGGGDRDIYSMRPDGSHLTNLTNDPLDFELNPDYSPNGREIVYDGPIHPSGSVGGDLWIMTSRGQNTRPLDHETNGYSDGGYAAWSPNGKRIAFAANDGSGYEHVWSVPASGGENTAAVTNNETGNPQDAEIDWQPGR